MKHLKITYTNYRNETADRIVEPITIWYGTTEWHPAEQWFMKAVDIERDVERDFAMVDISNITSAGAMVGVDVTPPESTHQHTLLEAKMFADGGSRGNPGPSAWGFGILDMEDNVVKKVGGYLGITTNNQAEYRALEAGLQEALAMGVKNIHVYMDSLLVVNQVQGIWKIKNQDFIPIYDSIHLLLRHFEHVTIAHVPRALNKIADSAVNECLDAQ